MKNAEITTIEELSGLMDNEALMHGRTESDSPWVHGKGIMEQWKTIQKSNKFPAPLFASIGIPNTELEVPTMGYFSHQMSSFWFNKEGIRIERPSQQTAIGTYNIT